MTASSFLDSVFRASVRQMEAYQPGEQPSQGSFIKLNTNENPYPPSPRVRDAILKELGDDARPLRLYSDPKASALRRAAARVTGLREEEILHGNGSDEVLAVLVRAVVNDGDVIAYPTPNYVLYETLGHGVHASFLTPAFGPDFVIPEELFGSNAKLTFLSSPNSPTGIQHPIEELSRLARSLTGGLLVVDEAYSAFAESDALALVREHENVVVTRTFSKSHGLAGLRVGLLFAQAHVVTELAKVKDTYNLDRLAIAAAAAAMEDVEWTREQVARVKQTRARVSEALRSRFGLKVLPSQANFVFVELENAERARATYEFLASRSIFIRYFKTPPLDRGLRISIGTDAEMDALLAALGEHWGK